MQYEWRVHKCANENVRRSDTRASSWVRRMAIVLMAILAIASFTVGGDAAGTVDETRPADAETIIAARNDLLAALEHLDDLLDRDATRVKHDLGILYSDWHAVETLRAAAPLTGDEAALTRAIDSHSEDGDLRGIRGLIRQKQYRLEDALDDLVQAQILSVTDMELRQAVQKARVELERFKIVMEQGGNDAVREFLYYDIADKFQRYERARDWPRLDEFLASLRNRPDAGPAATIQLAYLRLALGDTDSAASLLAEAAMMEPDSQSRADIDRGRDLVAYRAAVHAGTSAVDGAGDGEPVVPPSPGPLADIESDPLSMYAMPVAPWLHPSAKLRLAESLMGKRAFPALRVVLDQLDRMTLNDRERGRYLICLGESEWADGREEQAMTLFREAEALPVRDTRRGHIFFRYARYHARRGDRALALDYGQKSLDLTRQYDWAFIRIGALFVELEEYERGLDALRHAFDMGQTAEDRCRAAAAIADAYKAMGDMDGYYEWASRYIGYAGEIPPPIPDRYLGLDYYYRAELARRDSDETAAFDLYEQAAGHLTDAYRRAEVLFFLAERDAADGNIERAVDRAVRSAAALPGQRWKQRQVGSFLVGLDRLHTGAEHLERAVALADGTRDKLVILRDLADRFKRAGDADRYLRYASEYADAVDAAADIEPSPEESGLAALYRGDVLLGRDDPAAALAKYEDAARFLTSPVILADLYMNMAECAARLDEGDQAILYGRMALDTAPATTERRRRVQELAARFTPEAEPELVAIQPERPGAALGAIAAMADEALASGDEDAYYEYARKYVGDGEAAADTLSPGQTGLVEFFRAELLVRDGREDEAYAAYAAAARLLTDRYRRADATMRMARYDAERGEADRAAALAEQSADCLPDRAWKRREVGTFLIELGRLDLAEAQFAKAAALGLPAKEQATIFSTLAEGYREAGDVDAFRKYAEKYRDVIQTGKYPAADADRGLAHFYEAELAAADGDDASARKNYEIAADLLANRHRQAEALAKLAEARAAIGDTDGAAEAMARSVALLPEQPWRHRQAGGLYQRLGLNNRAVDAFEQAAATARTPADKRSALASLADLHRQEGNRDGYLHAARRYLDTGVPEDAAALDDDAGYRHLFRADVANAENDRELAYREYGLAAALVTSPTRQADILAAMARIQADKGDVAAATDLMERSISLVPDSAGKRRQAADFYASIGQPDQAIRLLSEAVDAAGPASEKAGYLAALAERYRENGDTDGFRMSASRYIETLNLLGKNLTDEQRGLRHYYRAELFVLDHKTERAAGEYRRAVQLLESPSRRSAVYVKLANHALESGDEEQAAYYADMAVVSVPDRSRSYREAGQFFGRMDEVERARESYAAALGMAADWRERATVLASLADLEKNAGNDGEYLVHAAAYINAVQEGGAQADDQALGTSLFYAGEVFSAQGQSEYARASYERAAELLDDRYRRSEALYQLSRIDAESGRDGSAATNAYAAAMLLPDKRWRASGSADVLAKTGEYDLAAEVLETAIDLDPLSNRLLYRNLAEVKVRANAKPEGMEANRLYMDSLYAAWEEGDADAREQAEIDLWTAQNRQAGWDMNWGKVESRLFGSRDADGDYYLATNNELTINTRFPNGFRGKAYAELGWTIDSRHTGMSRSRRDGVWRPWVSRPGFRDSMNALLGFRFSPIRRFPSLDLRAEYVIGYGRDEENDFRLRMKFDRSVGLRPRQTGTFWMYQKEEVDLVYSTRNNDFTSVGTFRRGLAYSPCAADRSLVLSPYWAFRYSYGGKDVDKGDRWSLQTGPGLVMRKYFMADRYNAYRAYFEVNLHYRIGLTQGRQNALGFNLTTAF